MYKFFGGVMIVLLSWTNAPAQAPEWIVYNRANSGLPDDAVYAIALANQVAWIGTANGLAKYANSTWTVYDTLNSPLPHPIVSALVSDRDGVVWIGTSGGGLASFDGMRWTVYDSANSDLPNNFIYTIAIDDNNVKWITTDGGLARFDGANWTVFNDRNSGILENFTRALALDRDGHKWIGTFDAFNVRGHVIIFDDISWVHHNLWELGMPSSYAEVIVIDQNNAKWIGTAGGGLTRFDGAQWEVYTHANSGLPSNGVLSLALEGAALWIGTGDGLARFDGVEWKTFHSSTSGLPDNFVFALAVDSRGNKWIGTLIGGLALYRAGGVQTAVASPASEPPGHFSLAQNYPNPFNPQTTIAFSLPTASRVTLKIYNVQGREVVTLLHRERKAAGHHEAGFAAGHLPSGVYFYRLETDGFVATEKMLLVR